MKPEDVDRSESFRLDFVQTVLKVDEASHTVVVKLEPDPKRYEWREIRDRRYLYDRFDNIAISEEAYHDLAKQVTGKPIYYQQARKAGAKMCANCDLRCLPGRFLLVWPELSELVPKFWGYVLKYTGDGLIAYFPEPSFITMNDAALYCALTMRKIVYQALNTALQHRSL